MANKIAIIWSVVFNLRILWSILLYRPIKNERVGFTLFIINGFPTKDSRAYERGGGVCKEFATKREESTSSRNSVARDFL